MQITDKNKIYIGGLPFQVKYEDKYLGSQGYSVRSNNGKLIITTKDAYPKARREKYIIQSAGIQLLSVAGVAPDMIEKYGEIFGNALYEFLISNSIRWVTQAESLPDDVIIGGLHYVIIMTEERDALLEDGGANGEIYYNDLEIGIRTTLPQEYKIATLCHEIIHGILYESRFPGDHNDESVVLPLGSLFFNFLRDNPILDKNYPHGDVDKKTPDDVKEQRAVLEIPGKSEQKITDDEAYTMFKGFRKGGVVKPPVPRPEPERVVAPQHPPVISMQVPITPPIDSSITFRNDIPLTNEAVDQVVKQIEDKLRAQIDKGVGV